eukprot:GHVT01020878.1.p1 GENE.GHVT01020878.1~~GHVT01020878.1.p1  ORF type:complete len:256 (+),score=6.22 GHVT01020878.1:372-1139(+)
MEFPTAADPTGGCASGIVTNPSAFKQVFSVPSGTCSGGYAAGVPLASAYPMPGNGYSYAAASAGNQYPVTPQTYNHATSYTYGVGCAGAPPVGHAAQTVPEGIRPRILIRDILKLIGETVAVVEGLRLILFSLARWTQELSSLTAPPLGLFKTLAPFCLRPFSWLRQLAWSLFRPWFAVLGNHEVPQSLLPFMFRRQRFDQSWRDATALSWTKASPVLANSRLSKIFTWVLYAAAGAALCNNVFRQWKRYRYATA